MKTYFISARAAVFLALIGCAVPMPPSMPARQDPFADLGIGAAGEGFPDLSIALVSSANTKETVNYSQKAWTVEDTRKWLEQEMAVFKRNFGRVISAESSGAAWAEGVDLVAVYDVYEQSGASCKYEETVIFLGPGGVEVDRVKGATDIPMLNPFTIQKVIKQCIADVQGQIERGIRGSRGLREFSRLKKQGPALAVKPAEPAGPKLPDILRPGFSRPADPSAFAVVVGVERYSRIPQADFAERDAQAVAAHLLAAGVPRRNLIHLSGSEASYSALKKYVETWLAKNVPAGGRVFFYFSGHGAPDARTGEAYLMPWDGDPAFLQDTAYPTKRLFEQLAALPAREVIVATDACFSGGGGRSVLAKGARPLVLKVETGIVSSENLTVFSASAADQITSTLEEKGHGMFTYFFLKGLGGEARDAVGRVTAQGLHDYLRPRVQDEARRQNRDQDPVFQGKQDRELVRLE